MSEEKTLEESESVVETPKSYSVTQYNLAIQNYLKRAVPDTWVHGVITQLNIRDRITYITLGHFEEGNPKPKSTLSVFMWTNELTAYNQKFSELPTPFELRAELKVSLLLAADYYVPFGKFQAKILQIDENFTLGELAQTRKKIIDALRKDGLLEKNKSLMLSPVPLRVGLITASGSAAYQDFTTTLIQSGFSFRIYFHGAKMQGEDTESTVTQALEKLQETELDVICIVRGGGSKTDLVYFDSEKICRAVANSPFPVLTGIGHEIDQSIADMVSHQNCITPTDCAKFLESRLIESYDKVLAVKQSIKIFWDDAEAESRHQIQHVAQTIRRAWEKSHVSQLEKIQGVVGQIKRSTESLLQHQRSEHSRMMVGLKRGPNKLIENQRLTFNLSKEKVAGAWNEIKLSSDYYIRESIGRLGVVTRILRSEKDSLDLKQKLIQANDPAKVLNRGYSLVRDSSGKIVKSIKGAKEGSEINVEMSDGTLSTKVLSTKEKK